MDDVRITQGTLRTTAGRVLPLGKTDVRAKVSGPIADVRVEQRFENDSDAAVEALYLFPLPGGASVHRMEMRIADRVVRAVVKEREEARAIYAKARAEGRAASLLEEDTPTLFTLSVANIPARATIDVSLEYQELVGYDDGEFRFVFPMVAPERYRELAPNEVPSVVSKELRPPRVPTGERPGDVTIEVELFADASAIESVRCATHRVDLEPVGEGGKRVRLRPSGDIPNRDFVVTYRAAEKGVRPLVRFHRTPGQPGTFLVLVTPPGDATPRTTNRGGTGDLKALTCGNCGGLVTDLSAIKEIPGLGAVVPCTFCGAILAPSTAGPFTRATRPRDVVILVDRSASMRSSLPQARRAVRALLEALGPADAVQVIAFDHQRKAFDDDGARWVALSPEVVARADKFLETMTPRGGTELERAFEAAAALPEREGRTQVAVLVTDAALGNEGRVIRRATEILGKTRRLFALGLGPVVDRRLVSRLARACGGASDVLGADEDVEPVLARFSRRVREGGPVLTGLSIAWEGASIDDVSPSSFPDLYGGEPVAIYGRYSGAGASKLVLTATTADGRPYRQELAIELPARDESAPGLGRLWAKARIESLMERLEREPGEERAIRDAVLRLALEASIVSKYTALVADDSEVVTAGEPGGPSESSPPVQGALRTTATGAVEGRAEALMAYHADLALDEKSSMELDEAAPPAPRRPSATAPAGGSMPMGPPATFSSARAAPRPHAPSPPPSMSAPVAAPRKGGGVVDRVTSAIGSLFGSSDDDRHTPVEPILPAEPYAAGKSRGGQAPLEAPGSDPYPDDELRFIAKEVRGELDLAILVDETGSMGSQINEVKMRLLELIAALRASPLCKSLRLALVTYRDHPPQDATYASQVFELTDDVSVIERAVQNMQASGGGDGPESVTDGLFDVVRLSWRPSAARVVVWFGDAPPHGVDLANDGFPQGCPCGNHWYTQAESLREMGIATYAVGCLPNLTGYAGGVEVYRTIARTTRGSYLPLSNAAALVPLIAGAASTALDEQRVDAHLAALVALHASLLERTDEAERVRWITGAARTHGVRLRAMEDPEKAASGGTVPMRFRELTPDEVAASLDRLRLTGRVAV